MQGKMGQALILSLKHYSSNWRTFSSGNMEFIKLIVIYLNVSLWNCRNLFWALMWSLILKNKRSANIQSKDIKAYIIYSFIVCAHFVTIATIWQSHRSGRMWTTTENIYFVWFWIGKVHDLRSTVREKLLRRKFMYHLS